MNRVSFCLKPTKYNIQAINSKLSTCSTFCAKSDIKRQAKVFGKLFGNRVSGSKQRWFENPVSNSQGSTTSPFNFAPSKSGNPGYKRRTAVLNKLFMTHITSLLATGEVSQAILGKGLQITRVKVTQDFHICNVYWMGKGDDTEIELEEELQKCGGRLRHELSQLYLMGEVPHIHFVKDKAFANLAQVQTILKTCDFGENHKEPDPSLEVKQDLYQQPNIEYKANVKDEDEDEDDDDEPLPEMRHDVFGLDHRGIMLKILAKMKKSEQAWQRYEQQDEIESSRPQNVNLEQNDKETKNDPTIEDDGSFNRFLLQLAKSKRKRDRFYNKSDVNERLKLDDYYDPLHDDDYIEEDDKK